MDEPPKKIFEGSFVVLFCFDGENRFSVRGRVLQEEDGLLLLYDYSKKAKRTVAKNVVTNSLFFDTEELFLADLAEEERKRAEKRREKEEARLREAGL